jgi:hypothetical protein
MSKSYVETNKETTLQIIRQWTEQPQWIII